MVTLGPPGVLRTVTTVCPVGPDANPVPPRRAPAPGPVVPIRVLQPWSGQVRNDVATAVKSGSFRARVVS